MKLNHVSLTVLAAALSAPTIAEQQSDFEAYLGAGYYLWDSDRNLDDSVSLELGAELPVNEDLSFEAWISDLEADVENTSTSLDTRRYAAGALYHLSDGDYRPFLSAGAAHQEFDVPSASEIDETLLYIGAGAKKYFDNNLLLRGEVLAMNSLDHEQTDLGLRLTLGYAFGGDGSSSTSSNAEDKAPEPADNQEGQQQEPEQASEPASQETASQVAATAAVEPDSDGDGVVDSKDQCADTDSAFKVDEKGCPIKLVKNINVDLHIKFKTNSSEFSDDNGEVKELADFLSKYEETSVVIEGHTDSLGSAAYNKNLSQKRADSVKAMLVSDFGIDASRIEAIGYGEEKPLASNDTEEGRAKNRRVIGSISADVEEHSLK